ncbi:MAG: T9SS type A sorting domain-containing protein, partial [Cyclobacteriaceae bacterium]|nr:T9SS type A sorting domain-containing protein [Cyclobacteriaceae bacterium]
FYHFKNSLIIPSGTDLWIHNLAGGTELLKHFDLEPGESINFNNGYGGVAAYYFVISRNLGANLNHELWKSDGTESGTQLVKSFNVQENGNIYGLIEIGTTLYFRSGDAVHGSELWKSDGTTIGTEMVIDLVPGIEGSSPDVLGEVDEKLLFSTPYGTYITNGTSEGTLKLLDYSTKTFKVIESVFLGIGYDLLTEEIIFYQSNGTEEGTVTLSTLGNFYNHYSFLKVTEANGKYILPAFSPELGIELYTSLGEPEDLNLLKDINQGENSSNPRSFVQYGDKVIVIADDGIHGTELWITDGTGTGTILLKDTKPGTESALESLGDNNFYQENNKLFFVARTGAEYIWVSDGTTEGTNILVDGELKTSLAFGTAAGRFFYDQFPESKLMSVDLETGSESVIWDHSGYYFGSNVMFANGDNVYFAVQSFVDGQELWRFNIQNETFTMVKDINPGSGSSNPQFGAGIDDQLVFVANDGIHGSELWITDHVDGARMIKDINQDPNDYIRLFSTTIDGEVFFSANDGSNGRELWKSDGTSENTMLFKNINSGEGDSNPAQLYQFNDKMIFLANDGIHGLEPWISDGTSEGTHLLKDINPTGDSGVDYITYFLGEFGEKFYFAANDGIHGNELWVTDGTDEGTILFDLVPGSDSSDPSRFVANETGVIFSAGGRVWGINHENTVGQIIGDFNPGSGLRILNDHLYFSYSTKETGTELFRYPIPSTLEKMNQEIAFDEIENKNINDAPFELTAISNSGLEVEFAAISDKIEIVNDLVTPLKPGEVSITAKQSGNTFYNETEASQTFCINPVQPTITLSGDLAQPVLTSSSTEGNLWYRDDVLLDETTPSLSATESGTYKLKVVIDGCESELSGGKAILVTGIETEGTVMEMHPNPTSGTLNVSISEVQTVQIMNSGGTIIFEETLAQGDHQLDISGYPSGVYFLKLISSTGIELKRWVKQ